MQQFDGPTRLQRLLDVTGDLYDGDVRLGRGLWKKLLARDMRVTYRQVVRWLSGATEVPVVVLVGLGAMLEAKRGENGCL